MRIVVLLTEGRRVPEGPFYSFSGARRKVRWPMAEGEGLGRAGACNAFLRMGYFPELITPEVLPIPEQGDLLLVCDSGSLNSSEIAAMQGWLDSGGTIVASGLSESWVRFLPGVSLERRRENIPYAGLAYLLEGGRTELVAPPRWSFFHLNDTSASSVLEFGCVAAVHGERQSPDRAIVTARRGSPAVIRSGQFVLMNGNPFAAFQAWLQGQEDLEPWLAWRHRLFWLDELVSFLRQMLVSSNVLPERPGVLGISGLSETTVVLRHDLDNSRDTTYVELEEAANVRGVHAILKDRNARYWRDKLSAYPAHEVAFHYNTAHFPRLVSLLRQRVLGLSPAAYAPARSEIVGEGLLGQVRWARRAGIGVGTLHRHLAMIYYPEFIDALDAVFENEPAVLGGSSYYEGQVLRWGTDVLDGANGTAASQFPYWFPFRLGNAGDGGRILRGWETASLMEPEPGVVEQMLNHKVAGLPQRVIVLSYHPAHANRSNFAEGGSVVWFREVLELIKRKGAEIMTLREVFGKLNHANTRSTETG